MAMTVILFVCMYNWYYIFDSTKITESYNNLKTFGIKNYNIMNNLFGMSEPFGYWTGFTMSGLLILSSLVIGFIYRIKLNDLIDGSKKAIRKLVPVIFYSVLSLSIIIISLNSGDSFLYSIINNILKIPNQIVSLLLSGILHNLFINDYFALLSSLSNPLANVFGYDKINLSLFITQVAHGLVSLITPFNIYLIAGLAYLNISYKSWIKYIWKILLLLTLICIIVLYIVSVFM